MTDVDSHTPRRPFPFGIADVKVFTSSYSHWVHACVDVCRKSYSVFATANLELFGMQGNDRGTL